MAHWVQTLAVALQAWQLVCWVQSMQVLVEVLRVYPVLQVVQVLAVAAQAWQLAGVVHWRQLPAVVKV